MAGPYSGCNGRTMAKPRYGFAAAAFVLFGLLVSGIAPAAALQAGVARVDITDRDAGPVNDPLYVKALVLRNDSVTVALVTVDAVALAEIGRIGNDYLGTIRARLETELGILPANLLVNASHCHGTVCAEVADRTVQAVKEAAQALVPVTVGAGTGQEDRIMENRRFRLKDGRESDSRRAYALPPDEAIAAVGPVDPEIGILRLDKQDGSSLAVVYNFACHPIEGVPGGGNTADLAGFASRVIEDSLGGGAVALFLQGFAGDINPAHYRDLDKPHDAEPLGNLLGLSTVRALREIKTGADDRLQVIQESVELPRADHAPRIAALEAEQTRLLHSLKGTDLNLKMFIPLAVKLGLSEGFPSAPAARYLHEERMGREDVKQLDAANRASVDQYIENIHTMEELTRLQTNLELLRKHQADNTAAPKRTVDAEVNGVRIGNFVLVTFPGEPSVQVGLNIKQTSPHELTFVAGCTNGYLYYAPTAEQLANTGAAQEDSDCLLAPEWQKRYEDKVAEMLKRL